jgi:AraC-like DNA-binding protein
MVRSNNGAPGIDRTTLADVEEYGVARLLGELASELRERRYRPLPARQVLIPKPGTAEKRPLARQLAVSERQLRSLFADGVGVAPKRLASISRVRYVLAHAGHRQWAQLTADCGYYDQSHMTAEFRRHMGTSPQAFATGQLPAALPC